MKYIFSIIIVFICIGAAPNSAAQNNIPDGSTITGQAAYMVQRPLDFTNVTPTWTGSSPTYNYVRVFRPATPVTSVPPYANLGTLPIQVTTTYYDGWGRPLQNVTRLNQFEPPLYVPYDNRASSTSLSYLPFSDTTVAHALFSKNIYSKQDAYYDALYPTDTGTAYRTTVLSNTNGISRIYSYAPGKEFTGERRGISMEVHIPLSRSVSFDDVYDIRYNEAADRLCKSGAYSYSEYTVKWTKGQDNQEVVEFINKGGQLLCKRTPDGNNGYLTTYYIYNDLGQLAFILPPIQSAYFDNNTCMNNVTTTTGPAQVFAYTYNEYGQVESSLTPGKEASDRVVYDKYNRPFLSQSPTMADSNLAYFTLYDKLGRELITGIFSDEHDMRQSYYDSIISGDETLPVYYDAQSQAINDNFKLEYWLINDMPANQYPQDQGDYFLAGCELHTINFFDNYDSPPSSLVSFIPGFDTMTGPAVVKSVPTNMVHGKLTGTKTRILDNGNGNNWGSKKWINSVYFYDEKGRVIQAQTLNPWQASDWDIVSNQYLFTGELLYSRHHHKGNGAGNTNDIMVHKRYGTIAATGLPKNAAIKIDTGIWRSVSRVEYNDLKQVVQNNIGETEIQDFTYNVRGQLTGINEGYLYGGTLAGTSKKTYASSLNFESGFTEKRYDGRLTGYQWRTAGSADPMAYGYNYDDAGRMTHAEYRYKSGSQWINMARDYTVSNISYDDNGNILGMKQRGDDSSTTSPQPTDIDELTYTYDASGTRLVSVADNGQPSSARIHDFVDGTQSGADYLYDRNGNLKVDSNRGITNIAYNFQDMPEQVVKGSDGDVQNIYTADGILLQKIISDNVNSTVDTFHYWGPFVYKNDSLQMVMHETGRARYVDTGYAYDYFVQDHLGNVRTIVKGKLTYDTLEYTATFEQVAANFEESIFNQIGEVRDLKPQGTPQDQESGILNGSLSDERIGAALLVHAMAGETFNIKGYGYYEDEDTTNYNMYPMPEYMLESLTDALTESVGTGEGSSAALSTINNLLTSTNYNLYENMKAAVTDRNYPRLYLNYLVFDENYDLQPQYSHVVQITGGANSWHLMEVLGDQVMPINGFILSYFGMESQMEAAVDNLHIINHESELLEAQHYYPHGLVIEDGGQGVTNPLNKYLFQGNKLQEELGLFVNDFNFRQYDAQIGRFMAVDPLAEFAGQESMNPYQFCFNDPGNYTDKLGLKGDQYGCPKFKNTDPSIWKIFGEFFSGVFENVFTGPDGKTGGRGVGSAEYSITIEYLAGSPGHGTGTGGGSSSGAAGGAGGAAGAGSGGSGMGMGSSNAPKVYSRPKQTPEQVAANNYRGGVNYQKAQNEKQQFGSTQEDPNKEPGISPEQFRDIYSGKTIDGMLQFQDGSYAAQNGFRSAMSGGYETRYVNLPNGQQVDMVHFLEFGDEGYITGYIAEYAQSYNDQFSSSAFQPNDYYSNDLGIRFYFNYGGKVKRNPTKAAEYIYEFLKLQGKNIYFPNYINWPKGPKY